MTSWSGIDLGTKVSINQLQALSGSLSGQESIYDSDLVQQPAEGVLLNRRMAPPIFGIGDQLPGPAPVLISTTRSRIFIMPSLVLRCSRTRRPFGFVTSAPAKRAVKFVRIRRSLRAKRVIVRRSDLCPVRVPIYRRIPSDARPRG